MFPAPFSEREREFEVSFYFITWERERFLELEKHKDFGN